MIGEVKLWAGAVSPAPPNGLLLCDGSAISRTTYSDLFALIGVTYGSGDGTTTFNLPDIESLEGTNYVIQALPLPIEGIISIAASQWDELLSILSEAE
jgi:microcystin-dependent protein